MTVNLSLGSLLRLAASYGESVITTMKSRCDPETIYFYAKMAGHFGLLAQQWYFQD